jgi:DNA-binding NarL/FixJ family response regulator
VRGDRLCVLIADADGLARAMLSQALYELSRVSMVLCAGSCRETLELAARYQPAVLVLDTALPCPGSLADIIAQLLDVSAETGVVTLAAEDDQTALEALRAGAVGHLGKDVAPGVLARQVTRVADGEAVVPRRLTMQLLALLQEAPDTGWRPLRSRLTTREWEVIDLLADGAGTQDIADTLVLSTTTVYSHIKSLSRKLGVHCRSEAIIAADTLRREEALGTHRPGKVA